MHTCIRLRASCPPSSIEKNGNLSSNVQRSKMFTLNDLKLNKIIIGIIILKAYSRYFCLKICYLFLTLLL